MADMPAIAVLGRKLDSIPFSRYHIAVILVLGLVGFTDGYDLALTGSLLVLAKGPLHITPEQIRWLTIAATLFVVVGGFISAAISDHVSRKTIIQIGVVGMTFFTLLIPFVQTAEQLIAVRLLTGIGLGFAIPIDQARRIANELVHGGQATQAILGVIVPAGRPEDSAAMIQQVTPGGAAAAAGIQPGEMITKVGDQVIDSGDALVAAIRSYAPGSQITITVKNSAGATRQVQATLGSQQVGTS